MNIIVKHIIGGVIFLAVSVGAAFGAFKYGEYVGNERATEELNRFKGILSKTEETKYLNGEWWFYVDLYGYHQRSDDAGIPGHRGRDLLRRHGKEPG